VDLPGKMKRKKGIPLFQMILLLEIFCHCSENARDKVLSSKTLSPLPTTPSEHKKNCKSHHILRNFFLKKVTPRHI
jgi:hypothetical protein